MDVSQPSGPRMLLVPDNDCSVQEKEYWVKGLQIQSQNNLSVNVVPSKAGGGLSWMSLDTFGV